MSESSQHDDAILRPARLAWQADGTPLAEDFEDVYFSRAGGPEESEFVFLRHNRLRERFEGCGSFTIAETGFGTGLNLLLTCDYWARYAPADGHLHFISFEKYPLTPEDLARVHAHWPALRHWSEQLRAHYPPLLPGWHRVPMARNIDLWLWFGDVHAGLADLDTFVDAWYLDGFAPARNPDMWTPELFKRMADLSENGATFATFTAAGVVRRGLDAVGFEVKKVPGFGRKRDMLCGEVGTLRLYSLMPPPPQHVAVVGAGLAGAHAARALAEAGIEVTVFEQAQPASGASGNRAGVFHPLVTADWSLRSRWYQLALETLLTELAWRPPPEGEWAGLTHLLATQTWRDRFERFERRFPQHAGATPVTVPCAEAPPGCEYEQGGWLSPPAWVQQLLDHSGIQVQQMQVDTARLAQNKGHTAFDLVVLATGAWAPPLPDAPRDMIRPVAGQVDLFEPADMPLTQPWVHEGYTVPVAEGWVCGATFEKQAPFEVQVSAQATQENLARLQRACPQLPSLTSRSARVSVRATTRDHMPLVGWWGGETPVMMTLGHGARGILSTPLAAQWLCHDLLLNRQPQFISLRRLSDPMRFLGQTNWSD